MAGLGIWQVVVYLGQVMGDGRPWSIWGRDDRPWEMAGRGLSAVGMAGHRLSGVGMEGHGICNKESSKLMVLTTCLLHIYSVIRLEIGGIDFRNLLVQTLI